MIATYDIIAGFSLRRYRSMALALRYVVAPRYCGKTDQLHTSSCHSSHAHALSRVRYRVGRGEEAWEGVVTGANWLIHRVAAAEIR